MRQQTTVCFTGHRPDKLKAVCGGDAQFLEAIRHELQNRILDAINDGYTTFLCGAAQGVDIIAGEIVLSLQELFPKLELVVVLPHPGHGDSWNSAWKPRLRRILALSSTVVTVAKGYHAGCFLQRDRYMVDHASRLIGVWIPGSTGGTGYTIHYAEKKGLKLDLVQLDSPYS